MIYQARAYRIAFSEKLDDIAYAIQSAKTGKFIVVSHEKMSNYDYYTSREISSSLEFINFSIDISVIQQYDWMSNNYGIFTENEILERFKK